jgi:signal transduction histidine kinase
MTTLAAARVGSLGDVHGGSCMDASKIPAMDVHSDAERRLLEALLAAESTERARLAAALHDDTIGALTAALFALQRAARKAGGADLEVASELLSEAIERTRRVMFDLSPSLLREYGLAAAIESLCCQTSASASFAVELHVTEERFCASVEELVYRTVREAVTNANRHSGAARLHVSVDVARDAGVVRGVVEDDGVGFDPVAIRERADAPLHLGLLGLRDRLEVLGGWLVVDAAPGSGTRVRFGLPLA